MALKRTKKTTKKVSKAVDVVEEAIHDDIQNGKIEAAMAAYEKPAPAPKPAPKPAPRTMRKGMTGADVENMQKILGVKEDGFSFGTLVALKKWQNLNGLKADGIAGPITQAKMKK